MARYLATGGDERAVIQLAGDVGVLQRGSSLVPTEADGPGMSAGQETVASWSRRSGRPTGTAMWGALVVDGVEEEHLAGRRTSSYGRVRANPDWEATLW